MPAFQNHGVWDELCCRPHLASPPGPAAYDALVVALEECRHSGWVDEHEDLLFRGRQCRVLPSFSRPRGAAADVVEAGHEAGTRLADGEAPSDSPNGSPAAAGAPTDPAWQGGDACAVNGTQGCVVRRIYTHHGEQWAEYCHPGHRGTCHTRA